MWCFKGQKDLCVYILPNQKKSFGKSSDIKLEEDATISRLHAVVSVESTGELNIQYKCVINDVSKYGTFVTRDDKKIKLSKNETFLLKAGDIVQFGLKEATFVVQHHSFVTARSSLNEEELNRLKNIIDHIGGQLLETWENSCTHLTVAKSVLFTTKLAYALASAKPIITIAYWEAVNVAIEESKELPEAETFLPIVKEDWLKVSPRLFLPNEKRRTLFKGLSFVHFCIKQYHAYAPLITAAGGKSCVYPTRRPLTPRDLTAKNAIVIQQPVSDSTLLTQDIADDYHIIYCKLQAIKRRLVSDTEIPLAILYCSTEKYCNSKFDFTTFLKSKSRTFSLSDITIIEDTQNTGKIENRQIKRKIIPETLESQNSEPILKKAHSSNESEQENDSNASKNTVKDTQDVYAIEINRKIIPETSDFQNSESISKIACSSNESEQRNISDKSNIASKTQSDRNISKKIHFSEQLQIIPESCSLEKDVTNNSPNRNNQKQAVIISETFDFNDKYITNDCATEKEQENVLQEKESFEKNNLIFAENNQKKNILRGNKVELQQRENILINEENNAIRESNNVFSAKNNQQQKDRLQDDKLKSQQSKIPLTNEQNNLISEKYDLNREKNNTTVEKDKVSTTNSVSIDWENCKSSENSKKPRIISIQETDNIGIYVQRGNKKNMSENSCSKVEKSQDLSKEQDFNFAFNSERNQEDRRATKIQMQEIHVKNEEPRRKGDNWYNKYLNQEFTDEILRKDIPGGKRFTKTSIIIPKRILKMDDFVL
ncbi:nibrin-like [Linepithema humile]|uniref:nibrin-like n=1 Tax=Linepithema humile TaxID=83485 RepID=UPI000623146F|nr:PREDICTED: nibrin-like [Linepithema humile]